MTTAHEVRAEASTAGPDAAEIQLRRELAAVYRLVHHFKMTDLIFTHISARLPGPGDRFLISRYGLSFEEITASNLVVVDLGGNVVGPERDAVVNPAGFVIHSAIHRSRPDAQCVLHTHSRAGCAVAAQSNGLLPLNQMSMSFYNRVGYHDYEGVALNFDEQARMVANLGPHRALILRNHGLLTLGESPAEAFLRMFYLDRSCQIQIDALSGGASPVIPSPEICEHTARQSEGQETGDDFQDEIGSQLAWESLVRLVERIYPDYAD
ncbi:class II aldolase/adducin family protein [Saccharopolyspora tripterygii]